MRPLDLARGAWLALVSPLWVGGGRMQALVRDPGGAPLAPGEMARLSTQLRGATLALRVLSQIPGRGWRGSCLFRSVIRVRAIRGLGGRAWMRIGVRAEGTGEGGRDRGVEAHAWVMAPGVPGALLPDTPTSEAPGWAQLGVSGVEPGLGA